MKEEETNDSGEENKSSRYKVDYDPTKIDLDKERIKQAPRHIFNFIKETLSIKKDVNVSETIDVIKANIEFKGANVWILICSIIVACIGLISDSTAVIIGAMLISPLMGPIRGIGLAIGTNDFKTLISSLINFGVMIGVSFIAALLFFYISPIQTATAELDGRVHPQALDVLIGFFGGLAGIIAAATGDRSTVVPGVAIATALMPPLCTAGYGLAIGEFSYFFGALYLFLLNSVFICLSTVITIRYLKFPLMEFVNPKTERKVKLYSFIVLLAIVIPSIWAFIKLVQENSFEESVNEFVANEIQVGDLFDHVELDEFIYYGDSGTIFLRVLGGYVDREQLDEWHTKMRDLEQYDRLRKTTIKLKNNNIPEETNGNFISEEMYRDQTASRKQLEKRNKELIQNLNNYKRSEISADQLRKQIQVNYGDFVDSVECGPTYSSDFSGEKDTISRFIVYWKSAISDSTLKVNKNKLEKHVKLTMEKKNPKFLHIKHEQEQEEQN